MKFTTVLLLNLIVSLSAFAAPELMDLNLSKELQTLTAKNSEIEISVYGGCGAKDCAGVALTVPAGSRVAVEAEDGAACSIQKVPTVASKNSANKPPSETFIVGVRLKLDSQQKCVASVIQKAGVAVVSIMNIKAALD